MAFVIQDEDRPYIEFERTINRNIKPRKEKRSVGRDGKEKVRIAHPGAAKQIWRKYLIGHFRSHPAQAPYTWVTPEWVSKQIKPDCQPIGAGNLDNLPQDYPAEWRAQLEAAVSAIGAHVVAHNKLIEAEARLAEAEKRIAAAESRAGKAKKESNAEAAS